jgi:superfamily I DNA and/or RNA helicase
LTHHYRSQHPALIAFSNKHFYQNQLLAYPTALQQTYPIQLYVCSDGVFTQRKNEVEAEKIARAIEKQVEIASDSIGVVAFSQEQLSCIWQHLSSVAKEKISENLETGHGFFKTLEQVQGEECEQLFISIGYGRNEAGKFQLRMGPLNRRNGYRRLNVLFTRAQKSIHLFTSVLASDFPITDNESMQLLRLYLQDATQKHIESTWNFPYALTPTYLNEQHVKFDSIYDTLHQADELITFHQVMQNRGWIVNY